MLYASAAQTSKQISMYLHEKYVITQFLKRRDIIGALISV